MSDDLRQALTNIAPLLKDLDESLPGLVDEFERLAAVGHIEQSRSLIIQRDLLTLIRRITLAREQIRRATA